MITTVFIIVIVLTLLLTLFPDKRRLPGPWNLPIIGYLHKLDPLAPYLTLTELVKKYGPVYNIKLGLMNVVVIADAKILKKVLAKDETISRPYLHTLEVLFEGKGLVYAVGDLWKDQRKFVTNFLRLNGATKVSSSKETCVALIRKHFKEFIQRVESKGDCVPLNPSEFVTHYISSIAGTLLWGKPFSSEDKTVMDLEHNLDKITKLIGIGGPLNFLPFLRFLPQYKKTLTSLQEAVHNVREIQNKLINECEKSMSKANKDSPSNLIEAFLLQSSKGSPQHIYNLDQLHFLLFDLFLAFTKTTTTSLLWTLLYLAQYEEVQNKVRQELCDVLQGKTIELDDFVNLHYTRATIAESSRIRSLGPLGFPHCASEDICVEDFTIPKDSMIMPLLWGIHMDPNVWKSPEEFRPERFLNEAGIFSTPESFIPFQIGRRICIGEEIAKMMMTLFIAGVLQHFKIGRPDSCALDFTGICGVTLMPKPQELSFAKI